MVRLVPAAWEWQGSSRRQDCLACILQGLICIPFLELVDILARTFDKVWRRYHSCGWKAILSGAVSWCSGCMRRVGVCLFDFKTCNFEEEIILCAAWFNLGNILIVKLRSDTGNSTCLKDFHALGTLLLSIMKWWVSALIFTSIALLEGTRIPKYLKPFQSLTLGVLATSITDMSPIHWKWNPARSARFVSRDLYVFHRFFPAPLFGTYLAPPDLWADASESRTRSVAGRAAFLSVLCLSYGEVHTPPYLYWCNLKSIAEATRP